MTRSSSEPAMKNFTWSQLKDQLAELSPTPSPIGNITDFRPTSKKSDETGLEGVEWADAHRLVNDASALLRKAAEEVNRVRAEAAEEIDKKQREVEEALRILRMTEEQMVTFEARYDEAAKEAAHWRAQAGELDKVRQELERRFENDQRMISFLEKVVSDSKARITAAEDRATAAEERARAFEGQLKALVGSMRQKLVPDLLSSDKAVSGRDAQRTLGALVAGVAFSALFGWFVLGQTGVAQADSTAWYQGTWGADCEAPSVVVGPDKVAFVDGSIGSASGQFETGRGLATFRASGEGSLDRVELAAVGENALVLRAIEVNGVAKPSADTLLVRCSLQPPARLGASA